MAKTSYAEKTKKPTSTVVFIDLNDQLLIQIGVESR